MTSVSIYHGPAQIIYPKSDTTVNLEVHINELGGARWEGSGWDADAPVPAGLCILRLPNDKLCEIIATPPKLSETGSFGFEGIGSPPAAV